ncbi:N-acetylmuramoyl-L-alanine amidase [Streptomyces sp. N35]|uniref:peptidoglycan recognition protein family protein n=1 Tax=Streptomyces sp. N35 TaxID=2795730 RepID=UPI0018F50084|nr:N-acetylmuramoyl-L-alanine amidase [Streptomyces sp. N35]
MARPVSAQEFLDLLRDEGLTVIEVGDWEHHNRNHKGKWGDVHGVMVHHTVTKGSDRTVQICRDGYSSLPGPLCHGVITKDGKVHLVGYGRTNHAGMGDDDVLKAVIAEHAMPKPNEATTDGNRHFYGLECENMGDGEDPWPEAQLLAIEKVAAAVCRRYGWGAGSVIGHREWQPGKVDPRGFSMQTMRGRIAARLDGHTPKPSPPKPSVPKPVPAQPRVSLAHIITAARKDPPAAQGRTTHKAEVLVVEKALKAEGLLSATFVDGAFGTKTVAAYKAWQKRCGYSGAAADGIPGHASLNRLAAKHGFEVTA